jgi:hypothetical protein
MFSSGFSNVLYPVGWSSVLRPNTSFYVGLSMLYTSMLTVTVTIQNELKLTLTSFCSLISCVSWVLASIMIWSFSCFCKCNRNSGCRSFYNCWPEILARFFSIHLATPIIGADESVGAMVLHHHYPSWSFGLTLCEWHSEGYDCTDCHVTFEVLWSFLWSHRYVQGP